MSIINKSVVRLAAATLLVGTALGAHRISGATASQATSAAPSGIVSITDWQFPDGCNPVATSSVADQEICQPMEDSLFLLDDHLTYQPDLAQDIPTPANGGAKVVNGPGSCCMPAPTSRPTTARSAITY
jgi:ABC-type transport system substrate-binding protein